MYDVLMFTIRYGIDTRYLTCSQKPTTSQFNSLLNVILVIDVMIYEQDNAQANLETVQWRKFENLKWIQRHRFPIPRENLSRLMLLFLRFGDFSLRVRSFDHSSTFGVKSNIIL